MFFNYWKFTEIRDYNLNQRDIVIEKVKCLFPKNTVVPYQSSGCVHGVYYVSFYFSKEITKEDVVKKIKNYRGLIQEKKMDKKEIIDYVYGKNGHVLVKRGNGNPPPSPPSRKAAKM